MVQPIISSSTTRSANWTFSDSARDLVDQIAAAVASQPEGTAGSMKPSAGSASEWLSDMHELLAELRRLINANQTRLVQKVSLAKAAD